MLILLLLFLLYMGKNIKDEELLVYCRIDKENNDKKKMIKYYSTYKMKNNKFKNWVLYKIIFYLLLLLIY